MQECMFMAGFPAGGRALPDHEGAEFMAA